MGKSRYILGQRIGKLVIVAKTNQRKNGQVMWMCKCDCGNVITLPTGYLQSGDTSTCGRCNNKWNIFADRCECIVSSKNGDNKTFIIDPEDYDKVSTKVWHINDFGYVISWINGKHCRLHRLIMEPPNNMDIDHINHNTLDNRKCNLRICTRQQNSMNQKKKINNTSGTPGVVFDKRSNFWMATIKYKYKRIYLGCYKSKDDAIKSRKCGEQKYYGEYAHKEAE